MYMVMFQFYRNLPEMVPCPKTSNSWHIDIHPCIYIHENIPILQRFSRKGNSGVTCFTTPLSWDTLVCWDVPVLQRLTKGIVTSHNITLLEPASTRCIKFSCSFTSQHQKPKTGCCTVSVFWWLRQESLLLKLHTIHTPAHVHSVCLLFYLYPEWDQSHTHTLYFLMYTEESACNYFFT